jgi:NAD(P)-dependent dehydrogenase (short-subunit alcohol dehydrogenase family)
MASKTAIVTGGARRIGRAIARHLASEGWDIALHYLTSDADAQELAAEIRAMGRQCRLYRVDLRKFDDVPAMVDQIFAEFDEPRLLVNSASIFVRDRVQTLDVALWNEHMLVNTLAPAVLAKAFCSKTPKGGCIINMLDQKVSYPTPDFFSYTVSKTALGTITRLLAMEYRGRCRVNGVAPGLTLPSGGQSVESFERVHAKTPLGVGPTVEEICRAISLLADSPSITGQIITIDGGRHLLQPAPPFDDLPAQ